MEIAEYLRASGQRRWLLVALPLACVGLAVPLGLEVPVRYQAVTSAIVQPVNGSTAPTIIRESVDGYVAIAQSDVVRTRVTEELGTGEDVRRALDSLAVAPAGASSLVEIAVVSEDRRLAELVSTAVTQETFLLTMDTLIESRNVDLQALEAEADRLAESVAIATEEAGAVLPAEAYRLQSVRVATLEAQLDSARADDAAPETIAELRRQRASERVALVAARDDFLAFRELELSAARAANQVAAVRADLLEFEARKAAFEAVELETTSQQVNRRGEMVQILVAAALAGLMLAVVVLLVIEAISRRRRDVTIDLTDTDGDLERRGRRRRGRGSVARIQA